MVISATSLMSRAYSGNVNFKNENYRENSANHDVVSADRKAMMRALNRLEQTDFESKDEDDTKSVYHTVTSYLDIYNNAIGSAKESASSDIQRTAKKMKELMKNYDKELEAIGIEVKNDGSVKINQSELKKATTRQVAKVFGNSEYTGSMKKLMTRLRNQVNREPIAQQTQEPVKTTSLLPETVGSNLNLSV